jgi:virginiamycin B lyase
MTARIAVSVISIALAMSASGCSSSPSAGAIPATGSAGSSHSWLRPAIDPVRIKEFADLPKGSSANYTPQAIASGPGGLLWVADDIDLDFGEGVVVGVATSGKAMHDDYYPGTSTGADFIDITTGPDGALWLTDDNNFQILRLTADGTYTKFPLNDGADPLNITTGPDKALWFTAQGPGSQYAIGRITTKGKITLYPTTEQVHDITAGPDGALWFTEIYPNIGIGRITTHGTITEYTSGLTGPDSIAAGPDGALWFTENSGSGAKIGRITTSGEVTEYSNGITPGERTGDIAAGPDGAMWFTEYSTDYNIPRVGRISMHGAISQYSKNFAQHSGPDAITLGPDGNMWFADSAADATGRVTL